MLAAYDGPATVDPDILLEAERKVQTAKDAVSRIQEALVAMDPEVQELTARSTELSNEKVRAFTYENS